MVWDRQKFSLATFIDWEGMKNLGTFISIGPSKEAFKCPVKFCSYFKIVVIEHHAILCGVNTNSEFSFCSVENGVDYDISYCEKVGNENDDDNDNNDVIEKENDNIYDNVYGNDYCDENDDDVNNSLHLN